jgi:hypothetical protein
MSRLRKPLLWVGLGLLLIFGALLGYASYREEELRNQVKVPVALDYGFIPLDLLQGRTHFEGRGKNNLRVKVDIGSHPEYRIAMARVACGVGTLGVILLLVRAFTKEKR